MPSYLVLSYEFLVCSVENNVSCHFERTGGESRHEAKRRAPKGNLLLVDFSTSPPFLSSTENTGTPVEMTVSLFYKAF
jgi:hypothetical protein